MDREKILEILIECAQDFLVSINRKNEINRETSLLGPNSIVDSIGLVSIVVDIESKLLDLGFEVSLLSEQAMSTRQSPFRDLSSLTDFILSQIQN